jgi:hypothetical protein
VPLGSTELGGEEGVDQILGNSRSYGSATHTDDVHVIVFNALSCRKVVVDQRGPHAMDFVGTDGCADAAAADGNAAVHFSSSNGLREGNDEIGIIISCVEMVRAEVNYLVSGFAQMSHEFLFQSKTTVIRSDSNAHPKIPFCTQLPVVLQRRYRREPDFVRAAPDRQGLIRRRA